LTVVFTLFDKAPVFNLSSTEILIDVCGNRAVYTPLPSSFLSSFFLNDPVGANRLKNVLGEDTVI